METKALVLKLIDAISNQDYSFSETISSSAFMENYGHKGETTQKVYNFLHNLDLKIGSVSYDHIDKAAFQRDLANAQRYVHESMLMAYGYKSGNLSIIGMLHADSLSNSEIQSIFNRLDDAVTNSLRQHTGHVYGGNNGATWGTLLLIFSDHEKAKYFNENIKNYYNYHFFKACCTSAMSIDCSNDSLTRGKAALGSWRGGLDIEQLQKEIWGE